MNDDNTLNSALTVEIISVDETLPIKIENFDLEEALQFHHVLIRCFPDDYIGMSLTFAPDCSTVLWTGLGTGTTCFEVLPPKVSKVMNERSYIKSWTELQEMVKEAKSNWDLEYTDVYGLTAVGLEIASEIKLSDQQVVDIFQIKKFPQHNKWDALEVWVRALAA